MPACPETNDYFEIPGYSLPEEPHHYTPMGRVQLEVGQVVRYRYYDQSEPCHKLGVVTKQLGIFPATGQPHYEISFTVPVQATLFSAAEEERSPFSEEKTPEEGKAI